mmetsp:Transcript_94038/g.303771  ORF Transcript_94038/g.303771 Transcript_94038/m.303771 type:complete len:335 (-) Transcript_94038:87-1091(-)
MALPLVLKQGAPSLPVPTYCGATKDLVVSSLQSASDEVVLGTLKQVGLLGPSGAAALGYVADVLKVAEIEASSEVRCAALAAVGEMGEPAVSEIDRVLALFEDDDPSVVCAAISQFNHSCNPNCEQSWDEDAQLERVHTSTFVRAGEELFLPYIDVRAPIVERARRLQRAYGFRCLCADCNTSDTEGDRRRVYMRQLERQVDGELEFIGDREDAQRAIEKVLDLLELYDEEGLYSKSIRERACFSAFQLAVRSGDLEDAKQWITKAYQNSVVYRGKLHPEAQRLKVILEEPEKQPEFQVREAATSALNILPIILFLAAAAAVVAVLTPSTPSFY